MQNNFMKTAVYRSYGPPEVLRIEDLEKPSIQEGHDDRVLIKVHSAAINAGDCLVQRDSPFLLRPMVGGLLKSKDTRLGSDMAGQVEALGENVKQLRPGDGIAEAFRYVEEKHA